MIQSSLPSGDWKKLAWPGPYAPAFGDCQKTGSGLFFHSLLLHGTAANRSQLPRRAITISYMDAGARYTGGGARPALAMIE